ncbi:glutamine--scyllo-inositol aminotransferase [Candidatus Jorgensenbacteria bacterium RIFCSPLOWO2_01_FULL_45_25b]|uniref:Glutamine--scyllo-inositol aminotransferase n=1 Tax=Candidatus Jorgensenbacteria bacterium RIFCSPLOWO2_01_FULL_45_25b TaxID=1798471 RepID=A0A1F6BU18_9BACT|nr:MAG: glutamine--scyllo-inositol aminotransferase [Candidatus Jorgensenbacteria bacterium RIFCSPLOWO2_01_FULL_45_25b]
MIKHIPVSEPNIGEREKELVMDAIKKGDISGTHGEYIKKFEEGFSNYVGCGYGIATSNGTTALHLALVSLGIGKGDEVLVSTFTNMASCFAILYCGATPVPIDIEEDTWNINPALLEEKITANTKAILIVHIYGHPVDMDPILEVARKHNLKVIEDAAEAHGAEYKGKKVGSLGDVACWSFYANKILTTGEGGMLTTNNPELAEKARSLRSFSYGKEHRFMHEDIGFNYRLTNLQAALGCAQLEQIEEIIAKKRQIAQWYKDALKDVQELQLPVEKPYAKNVYWMFHIVLQGKWEEKRDEVIRRLKNEGVETREAFIPYNMQKIMIEKGMTKSETCPIANKIGKSGFYLPSGINLSCEDVEYVATSLKKSLELS